MVVYVEYVILDNLTIDFVILLLATASLRLDVKYWRVLLGGVFGAVSAVFSVYVCGIWTYVYKFVTVIGMCLVTVGLGKKLFWHVIYTIGYTFLLGGTITGLFNLFNVNYVTDGQFYNMDVPLFVYVGGVTVVWFVFKAVTYYVVQANKTSSYVVDVTVVLDKRCHVKGLCDSGNNVTYNGVPVCFVTRSFDGFGNYFAKQVLSGNAVNVEVCTLNGIGTVSAVLTEITANGVTSNAYLALPSNKCNTLYNVVLSNVFCGGNNNEID